MPPVVAPITTLPEFERAPVPEDLAGNLSSTSTSDAQGGRNVMNHRYRALWAEARICGPALTVSILPSGNTLVLKAIELCRPGDVLVVDAGEERERAVLGGNVAMWAASKGVHALVTAGVIRDLDEVKASGISVAALGTCVRAFGKGEEGTLGRTVTVGGVVVNPGDLIVGDIDGVVVVPREEAEATLNRARAFLQKDRDTRARIAGGESLYLRRVQEPKSGAPL